MAPPIRLIFLMAFSYGIGLTDAGLQIHYYIRSDKISKGCTFPGYAPDGYMPDISPVSPPTVKAPASALAKICGVGATGIYISLYHARI